MRLPGPLVQGFRVSCYVFLLLAIPAAIIVYFDIPIIEFACSVDQTDWPGYFDSLTSSFMGVLLAYVATSITFYALLRSNLDRKKDENPRIASTIARHDERIRLLLWQHLWLIGLSLIIVMLMHFALANDDISSTFFLPNLIIYAVLFVVNFIMTAYFWFVCDNIPGQSTKAARKYWMEQVKKLGEEIPVSPWLIPITQAHIDPIKPKDSREFLTMAERIDELLSMHTSSRLQSPYSLAVITNIMTDRIHVLKPLQSIRNENDTQRPQPQEELQNTSDSTEETWECIVSQLVDIYGVVNELRNILHCVANGDLAIDPETDQKIQISNQLSCAVAVLWCVMMRLFVSCCSIQDFKYDGMTFQKADFINSDLRNFVAHSSEVQDSAFYNTKLERSCLDMSCYESCHMDQVSFLSSSTNNAMFIRCTLRGGYAEHSDMDDCKFERCQLNGFEAADTSWSRCVFEKCELEELEFDQCVLTDWSISGPIISMKNSTFSDCTISGWELNSDSRKDLSQCNFSRSKIVSWEIRSADLRFCDFSEVFATDISLQNVDMSRAILFSASFPQAHMRQVRLNNSDLTRCNLFAAQWTDVIADSSTFVEVKAQNLRLSNCSLQHCNASDVDWSYLDAQDTSFDSARLYNARLHHGKLRNCTLKTVLGGSLQLTDGICQSSDVSNSDLHGSNLTNTKFKGCRFDFADVSDCNATFTVFEDGTYHFASFQGTAFISAEWRSSRAAGYLHIKNASFQGCQFIKCRLSGVRFSNCEFSDCIWDSCQFQNVVFDHCTVEEEEFLDYAQNEVQIYDEDPDPDLCPV